MCSFWMLSCPEVLQSFNALIRSCNMNINYWCIIKWTRASIGLQIVWNESFIFVICTIWIGLANFAEWVVGINSPRMFKSPDLLLSRLYE